MERETAIVAAEKAGNGGRFGLSNLLPKGLYTRSLLIIIVPMLLLQSVVALVFMERHWELVTRRLSAAVAQDIAALIDLTRNTELGSDREVLQRVASEDLKLQLDFLPDGNLPAQLPKPLFSILDRVLSQELARRMEEPFWIDTTTDLRNVEIRIKLPGELLSIGVPRNSAYASNSHIFLLWMAGTAIILITISVLFLRNQIRPILQLANAAENLGKGRETPTFRLRGAREVRRAASAFFSMRDRIERQIEQRTTMLAGVSHDLRTVLTRLRLQIALLPPNAGIADLEDDIAEMDRMLEGYMAFARGDAGEAPRRINAAALMREIEADLHPAGQQIHFSYRGGESVIARPDALKRAIGNLVSNSLGFGKRVEVTAECGDGYFVVLVDDDGPGIPEDKREDVFRPFLRLDDSRNLNRPGSGLGLSIARDVARGHGGDVSLSTSKLGGLRARLHIPL
ncbi:ATP-binding protein [Terrihabitans rhizophilus]|jgi:two-component system osmolarity sensor histidine kinase EnvZ|uniref:histidine kinase n=1 Tax=Terrihabitans rhizophilus TaxID=3092662 RepID=A0ABU4RNI3_9HYPH|nr:ATP-binding protein [Terrihabitans sp. PJ23]MDX6806392.1 ATP-binding protein [Terrihabitans sp. PJ23]